MNTNHAWRARVRRLERPTEKLSDDPTHRIARPRQFVLKAEKTRYNLNQFERSAGDNGLEVLPFDEDAC